MQRRLDPETGGIKPFENVSCQGRIQKFFQGGTIKFCHFSSVFFGRFDFKQFQYQKRLLGVRGHAPTEKF